jgi:hypothetical protein
MPVQVNAQLASVAEDGSECTEELLVLAKQHERLEQLGLSLTKRKQLLREAQRRVVQQQARAFLATHRACPTCGRERSLKDHQTLGVRTRFGKLRLDSPPVRPCCRQADAPAALRPLTQLISERSTPELQYLQTRWASLVSDGLTVRALQDVPPVDKEWNISTVRRTTLHTARRCAAERGPGKRTAWRGRRPGGFAPAPCQSRERARRSGHAEAERCNESRTPVPRAAPPALPGGRVCKVALSYVLSYPPPRCQHTREERRPRRQKGAPLPGSPAPRRVAVPARMCSSG